jgi:thymidylate synthase
MQPITIQDMREYQTVVEAVKTHGLRRSPRGRETLDAGHTTVKILDPTRCLATNVGRGLSTRVAAVEAIQLAGAFHDPEMMVWASPAFRQFMDGDGFYGAYGQRIGAQFEHMLAKLEDDRHTRQAAITLWDPSRDNEPGMHDYPCTVGMGFAVREDRLDMHVTMRSNDVWLGFPYDVFQFTQLQLTAARALAVRPGEYYHTAWSMHLYVDDLRLTENLRPPGLTVGEMGFQPQGLGLSTGLGQAQARLNQSIARALAYPRAVKMQRDMTRSEEWYRDQLDLYTAD